MARLLRIVCSSFALAFTAAALIVIIIIGYPQSTSKYGLSNINYLAFIDTSDIHTRAGQQTYQGLPDSHDFSKHKDFFIIFIHRYCSGQKDSKTGETKPDFCSDMGRELFDQYRVWKTWGVDLATPRSKKSKRSVELRAVKPDPAAPANPSDQSYNENVVQKTIGVSDIKTIPRVIYITFIITAAISCFTLITGFFALCTTWAAGIAIASSVLATIAALLTATLTQILFPTLVRRVHNYQVVAKDNAGGGILHAKLGTKAIVGLWIMPVLLLIATLLLGAALHVDKKMRAHKRSGSSGGDKDSRLKEYQLSTTAGSSKTPGIAVRDASPLPGLIRRATNKMFGSVGISRYDDTSYETLRVVGGEPRGRSRSPVARSRDPSRSRANTSDDEKAPVDKLGDEGRSGRYEPYRHQSGP